MDFEMQTRKLVNGLLEPIIEQGHNDGKALLKLRALTKKQDERLKLLEAALFKGDKPKTMFDEIEERVVATDVNVKIEVERLTEKFEVRHKQLEELIFQSTSHIAEVGIMKQQFEVFLEKQRMFEQMFNIDYKQDVINQLTLIRTEFQETMYDQGNTV